MKLKTILIASVISAVAFLITFAIVAQVWVALYFPPIPKYNFMRIIIR